MQVDGAPRNADHVDMGRLAIPALALILSLCATEETNIGPPRPDREPPPPPALTPCHLEEGSARYRGRAPVLAPGALVVHNGETTSLHRLDERGESSAELDLPDPVRALATVGGGFVVLSIGAEPSVTQLDADGTEEHRVTLGGPATDGALAVDGDTAWIVLRDADDAIEVRRVDLLAHRAEDPEAVGSGSGRLLVSGALVTWGAEGAAIWSPTGPIEAPGTPHALVGSLLVYGTRDRTGLWVGDTNPVRVTTAGAHPHLPIAAPLREGFLLAYRSEGELWIQASHPGEGTLGEPLLVAPDATPAALATRGARFWVAWERDGAVQVRGGYCESRD